jgi:uncharacterized protein YndB with AHSA1/START domain
MRVQADVTIAAAPRDVFAFITAPEHGPRWQEAAVSTVLTTPGPIGLGSQMAHEGRWLGMQFPTQATVTVFDPDRRYGYDISSRFGSSLMRYDLEPALEGTKLTLSSEAPLPLPMRPLAAIKKRNVLGMFQRDVQRLKAVIEGDLAATAVARQPDR